MKVGDIVYCKETRISLGVTFNIEKNFYKILGIKDDTISVSCEENIYGISCRYRIKFNSNYYNFYDYFMTLPEMRKLKLNNLNEKI